MSDKRPRVGQIKIDASVLPEGWAAGRKTISNGVWEWRAFDWAIISALFADAVKRHGPLCPREAEFAIRAAAIVAKMDGDPEYFRAGSKAWVTKAVRAKIVKRSPDGTVSLA